MNYLILTGRFGMGHISAAEAVKEEIILTEKDANVEIIDFVDYMFPKFSSMAYKGFNLMVYKFSGVYNFLNKIAGKHGKVPLERAATKRIDDLVLGKKADLIIVTLPMCSQYIASYKTMRNCQIPMYTYITDITAHEEWIAEGTDLYFVGDVSTKNTLISKGVKKEQIVVSGIPVRQCFKANVQGETSKLGKDRMGNKKVLIMGGGLGLIPSADDFLDGFSTREDVEITLIAGRNTKLVKTISGKYPNIKVIGYTDKVVEYMNKSDLIITKSGGITTFEAIHTETPLYIIKPFLMQEIGNAKHIENLNIGRVVWSKETDIGEDVGLLLENTELLNEMKCNMRKIKSSFEEISPIKYFLREGGNNVA